MTRSLSQPRFDTLLINIFAALGVGLADIMLWGASRAQVFRSLVMPSLPVGIVGIAAGLGCSFLLARVLGGLLFGIESFDALTYSVMAAAVLVVIIATSGVAAWKGAQVDPLAPLRYE